MLAVLAVRATLDDSAALYTDGLDRLQQLVVATPDGSLISLDKGSFVSSVVIKEFGCNHAAVVMLGLQWAVGPAKIGWRPIPEGSGQAEVWLALRPVPNDVPPGLLLWCLRPVRMLDWYVWNYQPFGGWHATSGGLWCM